VSTTSVLYLYLESNNYSLAELMGSLLRQILELTDSRATSDTMDKLRKLSIERKRLSTEQIHECLEAELHRFNQNFLIVDGLHNLSTDKSRKLVDKLKQLRSSRKVWLMFTTRDPLDGRQGIQCNQCRNWSKTYYRCYVCQNGGFDLCTSCKEGGVTCGHKLLEGAEYIETKLQPPTTDIHLFLEWKINNEIQEQTIQRFDERIHAKRPHLTNFAEKCEEDPDLVHKIRSQVGDKAESNFQVAELYIECLKEDAAGDLEEALEQLPEKLVDLYVQRLKQMANDKTKNGKLGMRILSAVASARRELSPEELQHLLMARPHERKVNFKSVHLSEVILALSRGLVAIGDHKITVQLCHGTLREYFESEETRDQWFENAELDMAQNCLTYMMIEDFSRPCLYFEDFTDKIERRPFIDYAAQYWGDHAREAFKKDNGTAILQDLVVDFITNQNRVAAYIQAAWLLATPISAVGWDVRRDINGLHICAWFGLHTIIERLSRSQFEEVGDNSYAPLLLSSDGKVDLDASERTYGQTPLMYACRNGHWETVEVLLSLGASINAVSQLGRTALFEAVLARQEYCVRVLLSHYIKHKDLDINARNVQQSDRTALMVAVHLGDDAIVAIVECLLAQAGIDVNLQDADGYSALMIATIQHSDDIFDMLLDVDDINFDSTVKVTERSALMFATSAGGERFVQALLDKGADVELRDGDGNTALMLAAKNGLMDILQVFLNHKNASLDRVDNEGRGVSHYACANGHVDIVYFLHERKVDWHCVDHNGMTPLHHACRHGQETIIKALIEYGADVMIQDKLGKTPSDLALQHGHIELAEVISSLTNHRDDSSASGKVAASLPIWALVTRGDLPAIMEMLYSRPNDVRMTEPDTKDTALHKSVHQDRIDILEELLKASAVPVDESNILKRTPLHLAAICNNERAVSLLIDHHAELDSEDKWNETALQLSYNDKTQSTKHFSIAVLLVAAGADTKRYMVNELLLAATELGNIEAVQNLIRMRPDPLYRNVKGRTALDIAQAANRGPLRKLLANCQSFYFQQPRARSATSSIGKRKRDPVEDFVEEPEELDGSMPIHRFRSRDWTL
jgi:ankyrin repeat protein